MEYEDLRRLLMNDRSVRRFNQSIELPESVLLRLVDLTRYCASGRNLQPLKYRLVNDKETVGRVFPLLAWAGYLPDWAGPEEGERPSAYIVQCLDTRQTKNCLCDDGLQLQAITLGATAEGLGCCIIKSFNLVELRSVLNLPEWAMPLYVLALGYPVEKVVIDDMKGDDVKYWRSPDGTHHVPKRPLSELII